MAITASAFCMVQGSGTPEQISLEAKTTVAMIAAIQSTMFIRNVTKQA
jgi:hypothetical protein